jgi:hypothetical protein
MNGSLAHLHPDGIREGWERTAQRQPDHGRRRRNSCACTHIAQGGSYAALQRVWTEVRGGLEGSRPSQQGRCQAGQAARAGSPGQEKIDHHDSQRLGRTHQKVRNAQLLFPSIRPPTPSYTSCHPADSLILIDQDGRVYTGPTSFPGLLVTPLPSRFQVIYF